ncbi:hypothetical protein A3I18_01305 [Candidatus Campbellbacteria bacterium RIFCSPLOWO2_02_FULL_35_11]|uniref:Probable pectate lyase C n=1 Tax=Candidatus Campbellbacteria bacterium RIFCSPLOWO2_02_FULL_35_11 TaxID=1797581 RepID=A0A1F5ETY1_9BACT|nr:MAG: hypothetical protein A3I18_01305 [Candidatus Campbellbacteria bacterium RIFCSPLOWO2_02_FULL_35_11]
MTKKLIFLISAVFVLSIFVLPGGLAAAANYYVCDSANTCGSGWVAGNDANSCASKLLPCKTIYNGIKKMSGGDTLIIGDGVYTDSTPSFLACDNQIRPPSGSVGNYTLIKAEHDWQAIIDWSGCGSEAEGDVPVRIYEYGQTKQYIQIEGLKFINTTVAVYTRSANHIKLKKLAVISSPSSGIDNSGYGEPFTIARDSHYILLEDSWASGSIRYGVLVIGDRGNSYGINTTHIIIRRVVIRMDYKYPGQPKACFAAYGGEDVGFGTVDNIIFQNDICIDWNPESGMTDIYGGFYNPKWTKKVTYQGSIALNLKPGGSGVTGFYPLDNYFLNEGPSLLTNSIAWDVNGAGVYWDRGGISGIRPVVATADQSTLGNLNSPLSYVNDGYSATSAGWIVSNLSNSIVGPANITRQSFVDVEKYNNYNPLSLTPTGATNSISSNNCLRYLPRIESGSSCKGAGENGKDIGANILYKYGEDGTLWGEPGYDILTTNKLWPWPNENAIKSDFSTPNSPKGTLTMPQINDTIRGFAADGNGLYGGPITLTSYIWEYLGNPCPADICNYTQTFSPADTNQNGKVEMKELMDFIGKWKSGQVSLTDVLEILGRWMSSL